MGNTHIYLLITQDIVFKVDIIQFPQSSYLHIKYYKKLTSDVEIRGVSPAKKLILTRIFFQKLRQAIPIKFLCISSQNAPFAVNSSEIYVVDIHAIQSNYYIVKLTIFCSTFLQNNFRFCSIFLWSIISKMSLTTLREIAFSVIDIDNSQQNICINRSQKGYLTP